MPRARPDRQTGRARPRSSEEYLGFCQTLPWLSASRTLLNLQRPESERLHAETSTYVVVRSLDCATLFLFLASFPPKSPSVIRLFPLNYIVSLSNHRKAATLKLECQWRRIRNLNQVRDL